MRGSKTNQAPEQRLRFTHIYKHDRAAARSKIFGQATGAQDRQLFRRLGLYQPTDAARSPAVVSEKLSANAREDTMRSLRVRTSYLWWLICVVAVLVQVAHASDVLGELELVGVGRTERLAGVWIDGQYLGYLGELKGSKKLLL